MKVFNVEINNRYEALIFETDLDTNKKYNTGFDGDDKFYLENGYSYNIQMGERRIYFDRESAKNYLMKVINYNIDDLTERIKNLNSQLKSFNEMKGIYEKI